MTPFDYDQSDMHLRYDRARTMSPQVMTMWLAAIEQRVPRAEVTSIVDLGCGTGRFSAALANHFRASVVAIDPAQKMLAVTASNTQAGVSCVRAQAERVPLRDRWADLIFISMVWHHIQDKVGASREIARVLREGGFLCVRTATLETLESELYLRFFPSARLINERTLPSRADLIRCLVGSGLRLLDQSVIRHPQDSLRDYAERIALRGQSDLASIPDEDFDHGMERLRRYCARPTGDHVVAVDVDLLVFRKDH